MILEIKGKKYKSIDDLESQFTWEQNQIALPFVDEIRKAMDLKTMKKVVKIQQELLSKKEEELTPEEIEKLEDIMSEYEQTFLDFSFQFKHDIDILALLFLDENEDTFNEETYKQRLIEFKKIPMKELERMDELFGNFFALAVKSIQGGFLTSLRKGKGVVQKQTQNPLENLDT